MNNVWNKYGEPRLYGNSETYPITKTWRKFYKIKHRSVHMMIYKLITFLWLSKARTLISIAMCFYLKKKIVL